MQRLKKEGDQRRKISSLLIISQKVNHETTKLRQDSPPKATIQPMKSIP